MQSTNPAANCNANALRIKLTNNTNVKQPSTYNPDPSHNTNSNKDGSREDDPKQKQDIRTRIQQKLAMRGFKSLNRKTIQSPTTHIHNQKDKDNEPASKNQSQTNKQNVNTNTTGQNHTTSNIASRYCNPNQNSSSQSNTTNNAYYNFNNILKTNQTSNRKLKDIQNYAHGSDKQQNKQVYTFNKITANNYPASHSALNKIEPRQNRKYSSSKQKREQKREREIQEDNKANKNSMQSIIGGIKNKSYNVNGKNHKRSKSNLSACSVVKTKSVNKSSHKGQSEYEYARNQNNQVVPSPLNMNINLDDKDKQKQRQKSKSKRISLKQKSNMENSPASNAAYTYNYVEKQPAFSVFNHKYASNKAYNSNTKTEEQAINNNTTISSFRSPTKCGYVLPSTGSILCETMSKDGNYKIISRSLPVEQLKEAVELQYNINLKSKKQSIKEMQKLQSENTCTNNTLNADTANYQQLIPSPRSSNFNSQNPKYTLDPSKVSNKQNGNVKAYAVNSNQGISRKYNEDRVSIILNITKNGVKASYFAIYDGHGGSNCCDFLTQNLHQFIFNSKYFPTQPRQALLQGIKIAQTKFIQNVKNIYRDKKQLDRSGSCAIILLVVGDDCYIANLGDSRAVMSTCYGKPMYSLSRDHKPTDSGQQARILKQGGKIYRTQMIKIKKDVDHKKEQESKGCNNSNEVIIGPLRVYPGKLSVTRTFGDIQAKEAQFGGIKNCISIDPEICKYSLTGKQDFIILGCDGLFEKLDSQQVIEQVWKTVKKNKSSTIHETVGVAAQQIVKLCMDRKGTDNITTILVCLGSLGLGTSLNEYASV